MDESGLRTLKETETRLRRQVWLNLSSLSLSLEMSRPSCYSNSWPTLLMVAMGQEMLPLQLQPPTATSWPLTHRSSPRKESLLRLITGFGRLSPSLGCYVAQRGRRLSSPCSSCVVMPAHGGLTTPPLAPWTTKCRGLSSAMLSAPTTFQLA
jgi:hypothetical protein